ATERRQGAARWAACGKKCAVAGGVAPGMRKAERAKPQLVKDAQQIEIGAERFDALHSEQERDLVLLSRAQNFPIAPANREPVRFADLDVKTRNLVQRDAQSHLGQIAIVQIKRNARHADVARLEVFQEIGGEDIL